MQASPGRSTSAGSGWWNLLLLVPFIGLLWVPIYNRIEPSIFGVPFFYWYQFLWVFIASAFTWGAYVLITRARRGGDRP